MRAGPPPFQAASSSSAACPALRSQGGSRAPELGTSQKGARPVLLAAASLSQARGLRPSYFLPSSSFLFIFY